MCAAFVSSDKDFYCPLQYSLRSSVGFILLFTHLEMDWKCILGEHLPLSEVKMGAYYINYYFHNIEYDDGFYGGEFSAPDYRVSLQGIIFALNFLLPQKES